jgi:hypothetical protein
LEENLCDIFPAVEREIREMVESERIRLKDEA